MSEMSEYFANEKQNLCRKWQSSGTISDPAVLKAFLDVPREYFISPDYLERTYGDYPLPIGSGQTVSQPTTVMLMLQWLEVKPEHRVLEIGAGSGYNAAMLARLAQSVITVERHPELVEFARNNLKKANVQNVEVFEGDGKLGWPKQAPYERIIVTAAANEVPKTLLKQLVSGGILLAPVGSTFGCEMLKLRKMKDGSFEKTGHGLFSFVPLV